MKRTVVILSAVLLIVLTGCSPAPSREEVADRYLIEYTSDEAMRDALREPALMLADSALDGNCGDDSFETGLQDGGDETMFYAWRVTCSMYFERDLTPQQIEETKQMVLERASDQG